MKDENKTKEQLIKELVEMRQMEEELNKFRTISDNANYGIAIFDLQGNLTYVNEYFAQVHGYKPSELIDQNVSKFHNEEQLKYVNGLFYKLKKQENFSALEVWHKHKDDSVFPMLMNGTTVKDKSGIPFLIAITAIDITNRKHTEELLKQRERLAAVGQLAAGIAHDFNNILNVIGACIQALQFNTEISNFVRKEYDIILEQIFRGANLVSQILDFSRQSASEKQPVEIVSFIKDVVKMLKHTLKENIHLSFEYDSREYWVNADISQFQQILMNLAANAQDAMPKGGKLTFHISQLTSFVSKIETWKEAEKPFFSEISPEKWILLKVSDTGLGIPSEILPRIFDPFFTTKEKISDVGLGLSQVYGLVQEHEGHIEVKSREGEGTTFLIYLPTLNKKRKVAQDSFKANIAIGKGETILLVEDNQASLDVFKKILEDANYKVLTAIDGQEGLEVYQKHHEEIDLVLTDVIMPRMGGIELCSVLRKQYPNVKIIMITGYNIEVKDKEFLEQENIESLQKPVTIDELTQTVKSMIKFHK